MNATVNRQVLLVEKPSGKLGPEHFKMSNAAMPEPNVNAVAAPSSSASADSSWRHVGLELRP